MFNRLGLEKYKVLSAQESGNSFTFEVGIDQSSTKCENCLDTQKVRKFGTLSISYADIPINGKRVSVKIDRQRYHCKACDITFFEDLPLVDLKRRCTQRLIEWLIEQAFHQSFVELAEQTGLNESTIRRIFEEYARSKGVDLPARKAVKALQNLKGADSHPSI